ncbi:hypothetical protein M0Q28_05630 [Patescibacteria group bacterium]|jgi:hypothetical protein|nr:hypothetical protein [Patescibacteria group bacterium]
MPKYCDNCGELTHHRNLEQYCDCCGLKYCRRCQAPPDPQGFNCPDRVCNLHPMPKEK